SRKSSLEPDWCDLRRATAKPRQPGITSETLQNSSASSSLTYTFTDVVTSHPSCTRKLTRGQYDQIPTLRGRSNMDSRPDRPHSYGVRLVGSCLCLGR